MDYPRLTPAIAFVSLAWSGTAASQNILFFGNSYSGFFAGHRSVPNLVKDLATAAGHPDVVTVDATRNGRDFAWHLGANLGPIDSGIGIEDDWDAVVMQNFSTRPTLSHPAGNQAQHRTNAVALYQAVADRSEGVTPVLFQTWARAEGSADLAFFKDGQPQMLEELRDGYRLAAEDIDQAVGAPTAEIAAVGDAYANAAYNDLYEPDNTHANARGRLLTALVIYSTVFEDDTSDLMRSGALDGVLDEMGLTAPDGAFLARIADQTVGVFDCIVDVNNDGAANPADFNAWVIAFDAQTPACDQNGDGLCTPTDFNAWVQNYNIGC